MQPITDRPVRWGILATGGIASAFTQDPATAAHAQVVAVPPPPHAAPPG